CEEVDNLRNIRDNGTMMMTQLEQTQRERTGIKKLKVGYNRVFGYYIDIPRAFSENVPEEYIRKQTLSASERFFTPELKELEEKLLSARERIAELEFRCFEDLRLRVCQCVPQIQAVSDAVARLDVFCSLAETALRNNYVMPEIDLSGTIDIKDGRHPVVEQMQKDMLFVPNDTFLNCSEDRAAIITGPNMAGKSTYMRQTALISLMAQMGSFVPAKSATLGVVDRVFTRIGASDDLAGGRSTFMVEMTEVSDILRHATDKSLIILDEIGRGTSTYDGMAIARAVLEYCCDKKRLGAKTMFATHYHELSTLEGELEGIKNYNISAKKRDSELIFLRKIIRGAADDSYGIEVAELAGVPDFVVSRAKQHLKELESRGSLKPPVKPADIDNQMSMSDMGAAQISQRLKKISLDTLTPIEAMNLLYELKKKVDA
ncbi:MAG: DNA mismatch repair protein MutS, partial [Clostridiales bacterium]|nr:DNA mismatch repair protein MutS [Clostridiales bacterium]